MSFCLKRRNLDVNLDPIEILLVEDNPGDVRLTMEALTEGKVANQINVAIDGMEAMAFLHRLKYIPIVILTTSQAEKDIISSK